MGQISSVLVMLSCAEKCVSYFEIKSMYLEKNLLVKLVLANCVFVGVSELSVWKKMSQVSISAC